jgi:hypothetical protein
MPAAVILFQCPLRAAPAPSVRPEQPVSALGTGRVECVGGVGIRAAGGAAVGLSAAFTRVQFSVFTAADQAAEHAALDSQHVGSRQTDPRTVGLAVHSIVDFAFPKAGLGRPH